MVLSCLLTWTWCVCVLHSLERHSLYCAVHTHTHHWQICCRNTDYVHINGLDRTITVILAKHCIKLPDDGSLVIRNMLEQILNIFKYFIIILIVSTNYIFVYLLDNKVFLIHLCNPMMWIHKSMASSVTMFMEVNRYIYIFIK